MTNDPTRRLAEIYSAQAQAYADGWSPVIRPMARHLLEALSWAGARYVVDVGTGTGALLPDIRRLAPRAWILGVDCSPGMLAIARGHRVPLAVMDARQLGLRDRSADVVVMAFVLFHLSEPASALSEARRVLRPGGLVGTVTWGEDPPTAAARVWDEELDAERARDPIPAPPRNHEAMNTPEKVEGLLAAGGLESRRAWVERLEYQWDPEAHLALRTTFGDTSRRLSSLDASQRVACLDRIRKRLARSGPEDFLYRAEVVCAIGRRRPDADA